MEQKSRTLMVLLAMIIGILGFTLVANAYIVLNREMSKNYLATTPASASIYTRTLSESEKAILSSFDEVETIEERVTVMGRVQIDDNEYKAIELFVIDDFVNLRLDTFTPDEGKYPPATGEILLERVALNVAGAEIGKPLTVRVPGGENTALQMIGTVHAPGEAPAWMEGFAYGYVTSETFEMLGGKTTLVETKIRLKDYSLSQDEVKAIIYDYKEQLEAAGVTVEQIYIPKPATHPHQSQMNLLLFLLEAFGVIAVVLSSVIIANMISAIMEQQKRQIGILKSIGGTVKDISIIYMSMILLLSTIAIVVALPLGISLGQGYAGFASMMLNFDIFDSSIPLTFIMLQILVGYAIPIGVTIIPVLKSTRISAREALIDYGINATKQSNKKNNTVTAVPGSLLIGIRNTFRKKTRLIFTLLVMAIGGTGFIIALNIMSAMNNTVDVRVAESNFNIRYYLEQPQPIEKIYGAFESIDNVDAVEPWNGANARYLYSDGTSGNEFTLFAPPVDTDMLNNPTLYEGRWIEAVDNNTTNEIVINQRVQSIYPEMQLGETVQLRINGQTTSWKIVGILEELIGPPYAYVDFYTISNITGYDNMASTVVVRGNPEYVDSLAKDIEMAFERNDMTIRGLMKLDEFRKAVEDHLLIIVIFLIMMSSLVMLVGGLGLATTINMNVQDRTKEMGIMKAVGATRSKIITIILTEGAIIGLLSYLTAIVLSVPLSQIISYNFGMIFFEAPLRFVASIDAYVIWLLVIILFSTVASLYPAYKAINMPVHETLQYE